jgi:homoserine O-acetyltransferase
MLKRLILLLFISFSGLASELLVEKQRFSTTNFKTFNGSIIKEVNIGWESYGKLNAEKSNAILITHYFTGNSHAAGKYSEDDTAPGYWDNIIGPGKAIDTNKYFVISADTLANVGTGNKNVITTGPASINPDTGKPYGLSFPVVTIRDFVNVQKALLDSLGIKKLHAVIGPSMGSFQAIDWAAAYPEMVPRMISVIGAAGFDAWSATMLEHWANPIRLDKNWQSGNYYDSQAPIDGLTASLMLITQNALHPDFINKTNASFHPLEKSPLNNINASVSAVDWLRTRARARAVEMDANHVLYLVRACQLFIAGMDKDLQTGLSKVVAKTLFLPSKGDQLLMPYLAKQAHEVLVSQGKNSEYLELNGGLGHLDGVAGMPQYAEKISQFLQD